MNNIDLAGTRFCTIKELMRAILYGVATGDALGFPVQFLGRVSTSQQPIVDMGLRLYRLGETKKLEDDLIGLWSDDTSLTLCLAESLASGFNLEDQGRKMLAWLDEGYLSARDAAFDVGGQTRRGLRELRNILNAGDFDKLEHLLEKPSEMANGNGALMRILPLVTYTYHLDIMQQLELVRKVSALTHPHMRSVLCCLFYLRYAEKLLDKQDKVEAFGETQNDLKRLMSSLKTAERERTELYRLCYCDIAALDIDSGHYKEPNYLHSSGYVVHSLEAALWCVLNNDSYADTTLAAVRLGLDTDSIAAICGGLAAIIYGFDNIPKTWIKALKKPELFDHVLTLY